MGGRRHEQTLGKWFRLEGCRCGPGVSFPAHSGPHRALCGCVSFSPRGRLHVRMGAVHAAFQATALVLGAENPFD